MSDLVQQLREEAVRLSGHSIDRGSADAGIAANLADAAADRIESLVAAAKLREDAEPVAWQWRALEDGEPRTAWKGPDEGDRAGWEAIAKRDPEKYTVEKRPLYTTEQTDARSGVTWIDILREWFGGERYARDHEYLDANFRPQAERVAAYLSALSPAAPEGEQDAVAKPDWSYFVGDDGKPLDIGAGDALAIVEDMPETPAEAYAKGWNDCRLSRPTERAVTEAWQPIETAPRDGTTVLLFAPGWESPKTGWTYGGDSWQDAPFSSSRTDYEPTHWMPLPAAPALALEGK